MLLSSYCMIMWNHSSNFMDSVILKQRHEQKYYLCEALLDYGVIFYKSNYLLLKDSDFKVFKNWPDFDKSGLYYGKISWQKTEKTVLIKAELINKADNKIVFSLEANLINLTVESPN